MDTSSNHVVREPLLLGMATEDRDRYKPIPDELMRAAEAVLRGREEATVSRTSGGKLSKWTARARRAEAASVKNPRSPSEDVRRKSRQKMEKQTRRRNRGKK